jgi:hypothetical protein
MPVQIGPERSRMISVGAVGSTGWVQPTPVTAYGTVDCIHPTKADATLRGVRRRTPAVNSECIARGCQCNPRSNEHVLDKPTQDSSRIR